MKKLLSLAVVTAPLFLAACGAASNNAPTPSTESVNANGTALNFTPVTFEVNPHLGDVLATSGDHVIYGRDFVTNFRHMMNQEEEFFHFMAQFTGEDATELAAAHWAEVGEDGYTNLEVLRQATLAQTQEHTTIRIIAQEAGMTYDPELLEMIHEDMLSQIAQVEAVQGIDGQQLFYDIFGVPLEDFMYIERDRLTIVAYLEYLTAAALPQVSEGDIDAYIADQPNLFEQEAGAYHVLVTDEALAQDILARLNAGEDIQALADAYSTDPGNERPEGAFYSFPRGMMVPEFEAFAFDSPAGSTGIVETSHGFHVMLTTGVSEITDAEIQAVREQVLHALASDMAFEQIMDMVADRPMDWAVDEAVFAQLN